MARTCRSTSDASHTSVRPLFAGLLGLWVLVSLSSCEMVTGTKKAPGCIAHRCCEGEWVLICPNDMVEAPLEGMAEDLDELSCPSNVRCWLREPRHGSMPKAAAWEPPDWSPPRVTDGAGERIELSPLPHRIDHPNHLWRTRFDPFCGAGACHDMEGFDSY